MNLSILAEWEGITGILLVRVATNANNLDVVCHVCCSGCFEDGRDPVVHPHERVRAVERCYQAVPVVDNIRTGQLGRAKMHVVLLHGRKTESNVLACKRNLHTLVVNGPKARSPAGVLRPDIVITSLFTEKPQVTTLVYVARRLRDLRVGRPLYFNRPWLISSRKIVYFDYLTKCRLSTLHDYSRGRRRGVRRRWWIWGC